MQPLPNPNPNTNGQNGHPRAGAEDIERDFSDALDLLRSVRRTLKRLLDEVEAALDDTNLGRLLEIYEELRENSQLLVITHQKRTMEVGDAFYGVTMRGDGVSTVISQRLRDQESA